MVHRNGVFKSIPLSNIVPSRSTISKWAAARASGLSPGALALAVAIFGLDIPARAEVLSISATGLVNRCPCAFGVNEDTAVESNGVFVAQKPNGRYFVPVVFPVTTGQRVCSFTMAYHDVNAADTITARLFRKTYAVGTNPFTPRTLLAIVTSASGVVGTVREATTNVINAPVITTAKSYYYIQVDVPTVNLNILGFQIVYKPTCP